MMKTPVLILYTALCMHVFFTFSIKNPTHDQLAIEDIVTYRALRDQLMPFLLAHKKLTEKAVPTLLVEKITQYMNPFEPLSYEDIAWLHTQHRNRQKLAKNLSVYALSPDSNHIFGLQAAKKSNAPLLRKTNTGQLSTIADNELETIGNPLNNIHTYEFSPHGKFLSIQTTENYLDIYNITASGYTLIGSSPETTYTSTFSPAKNYIFIQYENDKNTGQLFSINDHAMKPVGSPIENIYQYSLSANGKYLFIHYRDMSGILYAITDNKLTPIGNPIQNIYTYTISPSSSSLFIQYHTDSNDGQLFNIAYNDIYPISENIPNISFCTFSAHGTYLLIQRENKQATIYTINKKNIDPIGPPLENCITGSFSPNGAYLFMQYTDHTGTLFSMHEHKLTPLMASISDVNNHQFSPNSKKLLLSYSRPDNIKRLFNIDKNQMTEITKQPIEGAGICEFSPHGDYILIKTRTNKGQLFFITATTLAPITSSIKNISQAQFDAHNQFLYFMQKNTLYRIPLNLHTYLRPLTREQLHLIKNIADHAQQQTAELYVIRETEHDSYTALPKLIKEILKQYINVDRK